MNNSIVIHSGNYFDFIDIENNIILIEDIAHSLSFLCRYNGHCEFFYSVAHHSLLVANLVPKEYKLQALLHDAAEAYLGDITSPLKKLLPDYQRLEEVVEKKIFSTFGLPNTLHPIIKEADELVTQHELGILTKHKREPLLTNLKIKLSNIPHYVIKKNFLSTFKELYKNV